jgi:zinc/manganese transport system permease protein
MHEHAHHANDLLHLGEHTLRYALVAVWAVVLGAAPIGVFLMLRRMSLMGDIMSHAILPGVAVGYLVSGAASLTAMTVGGFFAGLVVALLAGAVARWTLLHEDASLAGFYVISIALGVLILSAGDADEELVHLLFGDLWELQAANVLLLAAITSVTLIVLAIIWRPLVLECADPVYLRTLSRAGGPVHYIFLVLVMANLIAAFQALGTLLAVGIMMLPAVSARMWTKSLGSMVALSAAVALMSGTAGVLYAHHEGHEAAPAVVLAAGLFYVISLLFGTQGGLLRRLVRQRHLRA